MPVVQIKTSHIYKPQWCIQKKVGHLIPHCYKQTMKLTKLQSGVNLHAAAEYNRKSKAMEREYSSFFMHSVLYYLFAAVAVASVEQTSVLNTYL